MENQEEKMYIILFKDGAMQIYTSAQSSKHFQRNARMFAVDDSFPIVDLGDWIGRGYQHSQVFEIKEW